MARRDLDEWFWQVGSELQRLSEEIFRSGPTLASRRFWEPRIDVIEDDGYLYVKAEIAGVRGEDIQLFYVSDRHTLLIRGVRREEDFPVHGRTGCFQLEIYYGEFEREVDLPRVSIDASKIHANYRNGFLLISVPKTNKPLEPSDEAKQPLSIDKD